jgi:16S rRNA (adenine1518-N6/adenine1519-N6)-dimethyltransferase
MCDAANIQPGDSVIEIGPGTGVLTRALLDHGAIVTAIEADPRAISVLETDFASDITSNRLTIVHADARKLDLADLPVTRQPYKVVANIPYYLTGLLFRLFLTSHYQPSTLVFLIQKEVAKRICNNPTNGDKSSLLSLSVAIFGNPTYIRAVSRGHFQPPPKVDSAIIAINNISRDNLNGVSETDFFNLLHLGFGQKRKQLIGNLASSYPRHELQTIFTSLHLPHDIRAEDVSLNEWVTLTAALSALKPA